MYRIIALGAILKGWLGYYSIYLWVQVVGNGGIEPLNGPEVGSSNIISYCFSPLSFPRNTRLSLGIVPLPLDRGCLAEPGHRQLSVASHS